MKCPICGRELIHTSPEGKFRFELFCPTMVNFPNECRSSHYVHNPHGDGYVRDWIVYPYRVVTYSDQPHLSVYYKYDLELSKHMYLKTPLWQMLFITTTIHPDHSSEKLAQRLKLLTILS
jgi:hypothetical protein